MWFMCPGATTLISINGKALCLQGDTIYFRTQDDQLEDEYVTFENETEAGMRFLKMHDRIKKGMLIV